MNRFLFAGVLAASTLSAAVVARAQSAQPAPPVSPPAAAAPGNVEEPESHGGRRAMAACRGDMQALCAGVEKGGGRKIACLKDNAAKLSAPCQAAIQNVLDKRGAGRVEGAAGPGGKNVATLRQACGADTASLCGGVEKGQGRIMKCLKNNAAKLSPACQSAFVAVKQSLHVARKSVRLACAQDSQSLCGSAEKGRAAMQCLREKQGQASAGCQQALASLPGRGAVQR